MEDAYGDIAVDAFIAGLTMAGNISPAAWPGKTLPVTWMRCCGQTENEERMQHCLYIVYTVNYFVLYVDHCMCNFVLVEMCRCVKNEI